MTPLNEADTRAKLIDPKLKAAGWGESQIEREHFFRKGQPFTNGRVYLVGKEARRGKPKRVDYLLRYKGLPIAVLEAKEESKSPDAGLEQAKEYAKLLDVPFCYSSNGHGFVEFNFFSNQSEELQIFPGPSDLWYRWQQRTARTDADLLKKVAEEPTIWPEPDPLLHPYCRPTV